MIQALPTPGGLSRYINDILLPGGGFEASQNGTTYYQKVDVAWSGAPGTPDVVAAGWVVGGVYADHPYYSNGTHFLWWRSVSGRYYLSGSLGGFTGAYNWYNNSTPDSAGIYNPNAPATGTLTVTPDITSGVHSFVPTGGYTGGGSIWHFGMQPESNGAVFAPDWFGRNHGAVSGTSYPNKVNVTGAGLSPNIAADGWMVEGEYNSVPYYSMMVGADKWYCFRRKITDGTDRWGISKILGSIGSVAWYSNLVGSATPVGNYTPNPGVSGNPTVTADAASGTYLFVPAGVQMNRLEGGPTVCGQPLPVGVFDGVGRIDCGNVLGFTSNFSLMALIKYQSGTTIIAKGGGTTSNYVLDVVSGAVRLFGYVGGVAHGMLGLGPVVTDGAWHLVVGTFDGLRWRIYDNGGLVRSLDDAVLLTLTTQSLQIGARASAGNLNGSIALAAITPVAWDEDKIRRDWEAMQRTPPVYFHSRASGGCKPLRGVDPNLGGKLIHSLGEVQ
jgi:hypothetical protein